MFLLFLLVILGAAAVHLKLLRPFSLARAIELVLVYLLVGYYGFSMLFAAYVHLANGRALAAYKGWPPDSRFQTLYAFALIGLALSSLLCIRFRGSYCLGPAVAGSLLSFGGAYVHIGEMIRAGRFTTAKDGAELLFDVVVPLAILALAVAYVAHLPAKPGGA